MRILVQESLQNRTAAEDDLKEGTEAVEDIIFKINNTDNLHMKHLSAFGSWLVANSLCHGEQVNRQDIKQLWTHARKITDKIEECEQELDKLETEKEIKEEEQHQLQIVFNQTAYIHEQNVERLENLLSGGLYFSIGHSIVIVVSFLQTT